MFADLAFFYTFVSRKKTFMSPRIGTIILTVIAGVLLVVSIYVMTKKAGGVQPGDVIVFLGPNNKDVADVGKYGVVGSASIQSGWMQLSADAPSSYGIVHYDVFPTLAWTMSCNVQISHPTSNSPADRVFFSVYKVTGDAATTDTQTQSGYTISWDEYTGNGTIRIMYQNDVMASSANHNFADGAVHQLRVDFQYGTFTVYLDGVTVLGWTDAFFSTRKEIQAKEANLTIGAWSGAYHGLHMVQNLLITAL